MKVGDKIWCVAPACGMYDGMLPFETEIKDIDDISINGDFPISYCFLTKEKARDFAKEENKKAYAAFGDFFRIQKEIRDTKGIAR